MKLSSNTSITRRRFLAAVAVGSAATLRAGRDYGQ